MSRRRQGFNAKRRPWFSNAKSSGARPSGWSQSTARLRRALHSPVWKATACGPTSKPSSARVPGAWPGPSADGLAGVGEDRVGDEEVTRVGDEIDYWRSLP